MIQTLVVKDIYSRYIGSILGIFWSVIQPVTQMILYYFIFSVLMKVRLGPEYGGTHFAVWLIVGILPWMMFSEALSRAPGAVLEQSVLIKKMNFPSEIFPFSLLLASLVNHLIAIGLFIIMLLILGSGISISFLMIFPYLVSMALFVLGISWIISSLNVFFRDIGQVLGVFINIWFYLTPIIYPKEFVPEKLDLLLKLNPLFHIVEGYRSAILTHSVPQMDGLVFIFLLGGTCFILGGWVFKKLKPAFPDIL